MPEIGATLREARMRARIDVSEIEAQTKIRAKYLRALENEEWGLLPGPTFVKSFLRTYAQALGLDGKALVEEYRLEHERPSDANLEPIISSPQRTGRRAQATGPSRLYVASVAAIVIVIIALIVLIVTGSKGSSSKNPASTTTPVTSKKAGGSSPGSSSSQTTTTTAAPRIVALSLTPTGTVNVCLIGDNGKVLIPGRNLEAGESTPTYHEHHFLITLGNSSVTMYIDGQRRVVPPSSQAIGYSITRAGGRHTLSASQLPTCG
jgi:cytoskeleton protein RodZ